MVGISTQNRSGKTVAGEEPLLRAELFSNDQMKIRGACLKERENDER